MTKDKIFIIGGGGFLGSHLTPMLIRSGYSVQVLTRDKSKVPAIESSGANAVIGDILYPSGFLSSLETPDMVILMAMPPVIPGKKISKKRFEQLTLETTSFFRNAMQLAGNFAVPIILTGGTSYRTLPGEVADETWPVNRFGMTRIGEGTDQLVEDCFRNHSPGVIQIIPGQIYGNGGLFLKMYSMMQSGKFRTIGQGSNHIPRIHVEDLAKAYLLAIQKKPWGEKFIITDDTPCTVREFNNFMAECMEIPHPGKIPAFIVRLVIGKTMLSTATMNCIVSNRHAKEVLGWQPGYPSCREGLVKTISDIRSGLP
jgi:nucleoside-diphosphate-sugar epimerase